MLEEFSTRDSATRTLQSESTQLADVRVLLDAVIYEFPQINTWLSVDYKFVLNNDFGSGIVKVQNHREKGRNSFIICSQKSKESLSNCFPYPRIEFFFCRFRVVSISQEHENLSYILPTSNIRECLFPAARYALTDQRRTSTPELASSKCF